MQNALDESACVSRSCVCKSRKFAYRLVGEYVPAIYCCGKYVALHYNGENISTIIETERSEPRHATRNAAFYAN